MNDDQLALPDDDPVKAYWQEIDRRYREQQASAEPVSEPSRGAIEVFTFESAHLRTVVIDGRRWAVAADICAALGIKDASGSLGHIDDDDKMLLRRSDTPGSNRGIWDQFAPQVQSIGLVSEDGATDLVLDSRKPKARAFRRFLTHVVWPSIRDTGSYSTAPALTEDEIVHQALAITARRVEELTVENAALTEKIADDAPKVNYVELYVADNDLLKLRVVAANNNVGEEWLRDLLLDKGWIYVETERRWSNSKECMEIRRRYSAYAHKRGYFRPVEVHESPRFKGEVMHTLKATPSGAEAIARLIARNTQ